MSATRLQAAIFDRDGVLTYFDLATAMAYFQPLVPLGFDDLIQRWEAWGHAVGFPSSVEAEVVFWRGYWDQLCADLGLAPSVRAELRSFDYTTVIRAYPDARQALLYARECGLRVGVLSNFSLATLEASLLSAGLADLVDVACAAPVIGAAKPDPAAYQAVLRALTVGPEAAVFFDDEAPCVAGARAIGLRAYLVDRAGAESVDGTIRDLRSLSTILDR